MIRFLLKLHSCIIALLAGSEYMGCFNTPLFSHLDATLGWIVWIVWEWGPFWLLFLPLQMQVSIVGWGFQLFLFRTPFRTSYHSIPSSVVCVCYPLSVFVVCCMCLLSVVYACCPLYVSVVRYHSIGCCLWNKSSPPLGNPSTPEQYRLLWVSVLF